MKWKLILLIALTAFIFSLRSFLMDKAEEVDGKILFDPLPQEIPTKKISVSPKKNVQKTKSENPLIKGKIKRQNKQKKNEGVIGVDDPKLAITDPQGNIFPENITIDGDNLIAYGDLIVGETRFIDAYKSGDKPLVIPPPKLWPKGEIPYVVKEGVSDSQIKALNIIAKDLKDRVGINLYEEKDPGRALLEIVPGESNCYATVGYAGSTSRMSLSSKCDYGAIYHEVFHVLGFFHEQNRFDRDDYLKILWENIEEEFWPQFEKFSLESFHSRLQESQFSFDTIMLYEPTSFSSSSDYSMVTISGDTYTPSKIPTTIDYERVRDLYNEELSY